MTSIGELFPKCRKLAYDSRQQLASIQQQQQQRSGSNTSSNSNSSISDLNLSLEELQRQLDVMDTLVHKELPDRRQRRKYEIEQLRDECKRLYHEGQRIAAAAIAATTTATSYSSSSSNGNYYNNHNGGDSQYRRDRDELMMPRRRRRNRQNEGNISDVEDDMSNLADESRSLEQSHNLLSNLLLQGQDSLDGLVDQRRSLQGIQNTILNIANSLGISQTLIRIIERRDITDAYLVLVGIIITCIVIYVVWF